MNLQAQLKTSLISSVEYPILMEDCPCPRLQKSMEMMNGVVADVNGSEDWILEPCLVWGHQRVLIRQLEPLLSPLPEVYLQSVNRANKHINDLVHSHSFSIF